MAPALELETIAESLEAEAERRRVIIMAAVAAVAGGSFRILQIVPATAIGRGERENRRPAPKSCHERLLYRLGSSSRRRARRKEMRLRITLEERSYEVGVELLEEPENSLFEELALETLPESVLQPPHSLDTLPEDRLCRSPIAGVVTAIDVLPRQNVHRDDPMVVIEAMKMLNTIGAPMTGVVEEVLVKPGQAVKCGEILCRLS